MPRKTVETILNQEDRTIEAHLPESPTETSPTSELDGEANKISARKTTSSRKPAPSTILTIDS